MFSYSKKGDASCQKLGLFIFNEGWVLQRLQTDLAKEMKEVQGAD